MIFVSHAFEDQVSVVNGLVHGLKAGGLDVWYSREQLKGSSYLFVHFNRAIASCDSALIVLTPAYLRAEYAQKELSALHSQHIYAHKPLYLLRAGVSVEQVRDAYPLIGDLYLDSIRASETPEQAGSRMAGEILHPEAVKIAPVPVRNRWRWQKPRLSKSLYAGIAVALAIGAGAWGMAHQIIRWPLREEDTPFVRMAPEALPVKHLFFDEAAHAAGRQRFLEMPGAYRAYLGSRGYAAITSAEAEDENGMVLHYQSPAGLALVARLRCGESGCEGRFSGYFNGGQIQGLVFRADGTALGNWSVASPGPDEAVVADSFALVKK